MTGTVYLRARYYDPAVGRFTIEDTHWSSKNSIYGDNSQKTNKVKNFSNLSKYTYIPDINAINQSSNLYAYVLNNPIKYKDYNGFWTVAVEGELSFAFGIRLSIGIQLVMDDNGNIGLIFYGAGGGGFPTASGSGTFTVTSADTIYDLKGVGFTVGGSGNIPIGISPSVGIETSGGNSQNGNPVIGATASFGISITLPFIPVEMHGEITASNVVGLNWIFNFISKIFVKDFFETMFNNLSNKQKSYFEETFGISF